MNDIARILTRYTSVATGRKLGGETKSLTVTTDADTRVAATADAPAGNPDTECLRAELNALHGKNRVFFWITVGMVLTLFLGALLLILFNLQHPEKVQVIFGIMGVSIMGLVYYMNKLWKDITSVGILNNVIGSLDKEALNSVLAVLLKTTFR